MSETHFDDTKAKIIIPSLIPFGQNQIILTDENDKKN